MTNYPPHQSNPNPDNTGPVQQPGQNPSAPGYDQYSQQQYPQGQFQQQYPQDPQQGVPQQQGGYDGYGGQQPPYVDQGGGYVGGYGGDGNQYGGPGDGSYGGPGGPGEGGGKKKKKRLGLILGITIPVAVIAILGLLAAIFVPQYLKQQEIDEAVATYNQEHDAWSTTFTEDQLAALESSFDGLDVLSAANGDYSGDGSFGETCSQLDGLAPVFEELSGGEPPARPNVEDAEGNEEYDAAVQQYSEYQARYEGSAELLELIESTMGSAPAECAFVGEFTEIYDRYQGNLDSLESFARALSDGDEYRLPAIEEDGEWIITCQSSYGCYDESTSSKRQANADAYESAYVAYADDMVGLYTNHCPAGMDDACSVYVQYWEEYGALEREVVNSFTSDPVEQIEEHDVVSYDRLQAEGDVNDWLSSNSVTSGHDDPLIASAESFNGSRDALLNQAGIVLGGEESEQ
ncbi:hypothetical protein [uncultured Agrococcus sp.]|uniref:hypothetical protein n=1 Tax=uncultured Agrococcus sp. TaxID=382258 RepID=UPI0025F19A51|nr:hypothetical protein [uncultured Agrococcus sp.]